jgi:DNA-binding transcriptional LysR family regulator
MPAANYVLFSNVITCFDWLMPVMDEFRSHWPEVEVDLVAGFSQ